MVSTKKILVERSRVAGAKKFLCDFRVYKSNFLETRIKYVEVNVLDLVAVLNICIFQSNIILLFFFFTFELEEPKGENDGKK